MAGLILALAIGLGVQTCTVQKQAGEVAKAKVAVDQAEQVNTENLDTITDLETRLTDAVEGRRADEARQETAAQNWNVEREKLRAAANEIRTETIEVYRDPTCADLAKINVTAICPAFVSGMRQRADRVNEGRDSRSPGPGTDSPIE